MMLHCNCFWSYRDNSPPGQFPTIIQRAFKLDNTNDWPLTYECIDLVHFSWSQRLNGSCPRDMTNWYLFRFCTTKWALFCMLFVLNCGHFDILTPHWPHFDLLCKNCWHFEEGYPSHMFVLISFRRTQNHFQTFVPIKVSVRNHSRLFLYYMPS